ncbi:unnamed protein product, partial [Scytosiphon promiscuus]
RSSSVGSASRRRVKRVESASGVCCVAVKGKAAASTTRKTRVHGRERRKQEPTASVVVRGCCRPGTATAALATMKAVAKVTTPTPVLRRRHSEAHKKSGRDGRVIPGGAAAAA